MSKIRRVAFKLSDEDFKAYSAAVAAGAESEFIADKIKDLQANGYEDVIETDVYSQLARQSKYSRDIKMFKHILARGDANYILVTSDSDGFSVLSGLLDWHVGFYLKRSFLNVLEARCDNFRYDVMRNWELHLDQEQHPDIVINLQRAISGGGCDNPSVFFETYVEPLFDKETRELLAQEPPPIDDFF